MRDRLAFSLALSAAILGIAVGGCSGNDDGGQDVPQSPNGNRSVENRPDENAGAQVQVVYALPADGEDRHMDTDGTISASVDAIQAWLAGETGGRTLRFDTYNSEYDILFFQSRRADADLAAEGAFVRDALEAEMEQEGIIAPGKVYAVYYDGLSTYACGGGAWPPSLPGVVAAMYLKGDIPSVYDCTLNAFASAIDEPDSAEYVMLHEILHTLGFLAPCAPNEHSEGHASDSHFDLMYSGPEEEGDPRVLDFGHDDYYNHSKPGCPDFADSEYLSDAEG
jgi:hypothetical protein